VLTVVQRVHHLLFVDRGHFLLIASCSGLVPRLTKANCFIERMGAQLATGASGRGDGSLAANLNIRPADLRDPAHFKRGASELEIAKTLARDP